MAFMLLMSHDRALFFLEFAACGVVMAAKKRGESLLLSLGVVVGGKKNWGDKL